jgi:hypothetical protein
MLRLTCNTDYLQKPFAEKLEMKFHKSQSTAMS